MRITCMAVALCCMWAAGSPLQLPLHVCAVDQDGTARTPLLQRRLHGLLHLVGRHCQGLKAGRAAVGRAQHLQGHSQAVTG